MDMQQALRAENDELRERVRQFQQILSDPLPLLWNLPLPVMKARLLGILYRTRGLVPRERLQVAMRGLDSDADPKGIDVHICQLRKRLKPHDITIENMRGNGYALPAVSRTKISALIERQKQAESEAVR